MNPLHLLQQQIELYPSKHYTTLNAKCEDYMSIVNQLIETKDFQTLKIFISNYSNEYIFTTCSEKMVTYYLSIELQLEDIECLTLLYLFLGHHYIYSLKKYVKQKLFRRTNGNYLSITKNQLKQVF